MRAGTGAGYGKQFAPDVVVPVVLGAAAAVLQMQCWVLQMQCWVLQMQCWVLQL